MKKILIFSAIILLLLPPFSPSAEKQATPQEIKEYVEEALAIYKIPGASLAIIEKGELIFHEQWGVTSAGAAVTVDTPFLIGSLSKPITSLAVMMLVEEGKIKLDDPIQTYLPSFRYQSASSKPLTVLHLLEHTSGMSEFAGLKVTDNDQTSGESITQAITELSDVALSHEPGEVYEYHSANYLLLGAIIEAVANEPFSEFANSRIFTPLGMKHTAAEYKKAAAVGLVPGYESWFGRPVKSSGLYDDTGASYGYIASSTNDLAAFLTFMLAGGELLSEQSLGLIKTPPEDGKTYSYGWHFSKTGGFPFHGGATPDFRGEMFFIPEQDVAAVLLTNKYHALEDAQVFYIMNGIRSLLNGENPGNLPSPSHSTQWIVLGITVFLAVLTVVHFFYLRKKKIINKIMSFSVGSASLLLAAVFIPLFAYVSGNPWKSVKLFAPDIAFLFYCLTAIIAVNGAMAFLSPLFKNKAAQ